MAIVNQKAWEEVRNLVRQRLGRIAGAAMVVSLSHLSVGEKVRWLYPRREHPDASVVAAVAGRLRALGVPDFAAAADVLSIQGSVRERLEHFTSEQLKDLAKLVRQTTGDALGGTTKEARAMALAPVLGTQEGLRRFYEHLAPDAKRAVGVLVWRDRSLPVSDVERALGSPVVLRQKLTYGGERISLNPHFAVLLVLYAPPYGGVSTVHMHPWLRARLRPLVPIPAQARLQGRSEPPAYADGRVLLGVPSVAGVLPAMDAMSSQAVIPRKQNGAPTVAGLR